MNYPMYPVAYNPYQSSGMVAPTQQQPGSGPNMVQAPIKSKSGISNSSQQFASTSSSTTTSSNVPPGFQGQMVTTNWTSAQTDSVTISLGPNASVMVDSTGQIVTVTTAESSSTYRNVNRIMLQLTRSSVSSS